MMTPRGFQPVRLLLLPSNCFQHTRPQHRQSCLIYSRTDFLAWIASSMELLAIVMVHRVDHQVRFIPLCQTLANCVVHHLAHHSNVESESLCRHLGGSP